MARRKQKLYGKKATTEDIVLEIQNLLYAKSNRPYQNGMNDSRLESNTSLVFSFSYLVVPFCIFYFVVFAYLSSPLFVIYHLFSLVFSWSYYSSKSSSH
jgi:hypothetical protein